MRATVRGHGEVRVIDLVGELTSGMGVVVLRQRLRQVLEEGCWQIVVNLRRVSRIDRGGVEALQRCRVDAVGSGIDVQIANLEEPHQPQTELERWLNLESGTASGGGQYGVF